VAGGQQVVTLFEGVAGACHVELIRFVKQLECAMQEHVIRIADYGDRYSKLECLQKLLVRQGCSDFFPLQFRAHQVRFARGFLTECALDSTRGCLAHTRTSGSCSRMAARSMGLSSIITTLRGSRFTEATISARFLCLAAKIDFANDEIVQGNLALHDLVPV
jgi:hypothetical protein